MVMLKEYGPPALDPLAPVIDRIPADLLPWIAEKHVQYLDDRIHKIDILTDYLANCSPVERERREFIEFVLSNTRAENPDLTVYLRDYSIRFSMVRCRVEELCESVHDEALWKSPTDLLRFWRQFAFINEVDSLHGMFLTSGRWYVNVMLPAVKELVYCSLPPSIDPSDRNRVAYSVARRVITPRHVEEGLETFPALERRFTSLFIPLLTYYDRKLLFLFEVMASLPGPTAGIGNLATLVENVAKRPDIYSDLLSQGIYPPFGWHELLASRRRRSPAQDYTKAASKLWAEVPTEMCDRTERALHLLDVFKDYELNYNNYNYKGKFGLVSKYQYWRTAELMPKPVCASFLEAILGDRFFDALRCVEEVFDS